MPSATPPANSLAESAGSELEALYTRLDDEIASARATCAACGTCCDFMRAGHRLYVSTAELALLASVRPAEPSPREPLRCPYQIAGACTARQRRPLGCRVHFCTPPAEQWCQEIYERYHHAIGALHETHSIPYRYVELTAALTELLDRSASMG